MAAYLDYREIKVYLDGGWFDITSDIVSPIKCDWGISGNSPLDRIAQAGTMSFDVNNINKNYSPGSATTYGIIKGTPIKLTLAYDGATYVRFYGLVDEVKIQSGDRGTRRATINAVDWMEIASTYPLILPQSYTNKRADQGVTLIVDAMPIQPQARDFATTNDTFGIIFDVIKSRTKALTEFAKLMLSEFGYLYLRKDKLYGETLMIEAKHDRDSGITQSTIPVTSDTSGRMLAEDGSYVLAEDGYKIINDESTTYDFDNSMLSLETIYGDNYYNYVVVRNYPRLVGASTAVLYQINAPISLAAGETKTNLKGSYTDPVAGGTQINGTGMTTPVSGTDYKMYQNSDGTGTNLTANLSVTADYGTDGVIYTITNTGGTAGYVTLLQARGYPVYVYNPVEQFTQDNASVLQNGYNELLVDQKYSTTLLPNIGLAQVLLSQEKDAKVVVSKINLLANTSPQHMNSFLQYDVGSLIKIEENQTGTNDYFFIQAVDFQIDLGGVIKYSYLLKNAVTLSSSYWTLETAGKSELESTTFVSY